MAAKQGEVNSQFYLGNNYYKGLGFDKDILKSYAWFKIASLQGDKQSLANLNFIIKKMTIQQIQLANELKTQIEFDIDKNRREINNN